MCSLFCAASLAFLTVAQREPASVTVGPHHFTLPSGWQATVAVPPTLVARPISAVFDEKGRLFVTESSGSNEAPAIQAEKKPHRILRLEDTDGDGVFDKKTVFADKLMLPQGIAYSQGEIWVGTPPQIWRLIDENDDGVADKRILFHDGGTLTGCMNDLHGPAIGKDGRIYWTKGAFAEQKHTINGKTFVTSASHLFSAKPDGTGMTVEMTGGMDNPVGIAFNSMGDRFVSCTFVHHPGNGLRDGIIHAVPWVLYGKDHKPIQNGVHKRTSMSLGDPLVELGPAAPCGMAMLNNPANGLAGRLACCQFNMRKVSVHQLKPEGAGFTADSADLIVSDFKDFHPTDVLEDVDGSILVVDTGGWYKLCCPSSQMVKDEAMGAIYRIKASKLRKVDDPRGLRIDWTEESDEIAKLIFDPRPAVQAKALDVLVARKAVDILAEVVNNSAQVAPPRVEALWALGRIPGPEAARQWRAMLSDNLGEIRQVAMRIAANANDKVSVPYFSAALNSGNPQVRRVAAEGMIKAGDLTSVDKFLPFLSVDDTTLNQIGVYALTHIAAASDQAATRLKRLVEDSNPYVARNLLIALDQAGKLDKAALVLEMANSRDQTSRDIGLWILGRHKEWAHEIATYINENNNSFLAFDQNLHTSIAASVPGRALLAQRALSRRHTEVALKAMADAGLTKPPAEWVEPIYKCIEADDYEQSLAAIRTARTFTQDFPQSWTDELVKELGSAQFNDAFKLELLASLPAKTPMKKEWFEILKNALNFRRTSLDRSNALTALGKLAIAATDLPELAATIASASASDIGRILDLFGPERGDAAGLALINALKNEAIADAVSPGMVRTLIQRHSPKVRDAAKPVLEKIDPGTANNAKTLEDYLASLPAGNAARGHTVFNSNKAVCASCHKIGYVGGENGPDLSRIGQIRTKRDLLESIMFPSASFVRSYEPVVITTRYGRLFNGLVKEDNQQGITLAIGPDAVEKIPRNIISEMNPSKVSLMPAGIDKQITKQEMADLLEFLQQRK